MSVNCFPLATARGRTGYCGPKREEKRREEDLGPRPSSTDLSRSNFSPGHHFTEAIGAEGELQTVRATIFIFIFIYVVFCGRRAITLPVQLPWPRPMKLWHILKVTGCCHSGHWHCVLRERSVAGFMWIVALVFTVCPNLPHDWLFCVILAAMPSHALSACNFVCMWHSHRTKPCFLSLLQIRSFGRNTEDVTKYFLSSFRITWPVHKCQLFYVDWWGCKTCIVNFSTKDSGIALLFHWLPWLFLLSVGLFAYT